MPTPREPGSEQPRPRIVSGGQTGADRGGLEAAKALGLPHGGWCPRGRRAEDGEIPARYRLKETRSAEYAERTELNVVGSQGTVVFTMGRPTGGSALTAQLARQHHKPLLLVDLDCVTEREAEGLLQQWIAANDIAVLNVAGSRESKAPGLQKRVFGIVTRCMKKVHDRKKPRRH